MRRTFFYLIVLLVFSCNERSGKADRKNIPVTKDYPTQPVRLIEPFGAGGGPDIIARAISPKLSRLWGQPVTVENHPGEGLPALLPKRLTNFQKTSDMFCRQQICVIGLSN